MKKTMKRKIEITGLLLLLPVIAIIFYFGFIMSIVGDKKRNTYMYDLAYNDSISKL
jgi:uncharacterized membrane protein